MSITTGLNPDPERSYSKTFHHRNDSTELDVFEASRYFSGEDNIMMNNRNEKQSTNNWTRAAAAGGGLRRISLDLPAMRSQHHRQAAADQKQIHKDKKYKQPSSPGGRLASFLNSLFSQSKKKSKSNAAATDHELDDSPGGGRRKRRSSISHFGSTNYTDHNLNNISNSKSSGFRTPPAKTPAKSADLRSFSDYKEAAASMSLPNKYSYSNSDREKLRFRDELLSEKNYDKFDQYSHSDRKVHKAVFEDEDDGAESDSSSDLFELQNYDLGCYASGLPVYETTHMESVKRGAPISVNGS